MKKALFIYDNSSAYDPCPAEKADIISDVLDGIYEVTSCETRPIGLEELQSYHTVIIASENWDANTDQDTIAALISYTVSGGNLWMIGDALKTSKYHEMHLMMGARLQNQNSPCLQDFIIHKDHPITSHSEDFKVLEIPYYVVLDPFTETKVLIDFRYAGKLHPAMWCHSYGWGKVVCMAFGSVPTTYLPETRRIVRRTGEWLLNHI